LAVKKKDTAERKTTKKRATKSNKQQKKDLEVKIADHEKKLEQLLSTLESELTPKPKPAAESPKGLLPKSIEQHTAQQAPPPKPDVALPKETTQASSVIPLYIRLSSERKSELEAYEKEYLARLDSEAKEAAEFAAAAAELVAKKRAETQSSSGSSGSTKGSLPKGF